MGMLDGRVAIITGAGRGIGREHALLFADEGALVVVNDLGGGPDGGGAGDKSVAEEVVLEIEAKGGTAIANADDIADWGGAEHLVATAVEIFGGLDVVVNNAGVLRDRTLVNLTEDEWDTVLRVNLKGTVAVSRFAAAYWRQQAKAGDAVAGSVVNTSSESGVFAAPGQSNYAAAKSAVASLTELWAKELGGYGVRVNAILPRARTRLTEATFGDRVGVEDGFDRWHPGNVSPFVAYLASAGCPLSGEVFLTGGSVVQRVRAWELDPAWRIEGSGRFDPDALAEAAAALGSPEAPRRPPASLETW